MSFFQEMINEFKQEMQKEMAANMGHAPANMGQTPANMGQTPANSGVRISDSTSTKKQRKKAPQKKSASTAKRPQPQTQAQPQSQTVATGQAHQLVANLNPQTARNAIIMAEIIGPPVSRRQRKRV